jgi:hypothetical protein
MSHTKAATTTRASDHGVGLIPPDEIFGRVLPHGPIIPDADQPFEERVERAVRRLMAGFHEHEHDRLREVLAIRFLDCARKHTASAK